MCWLHNVRIVSTLWGKLIRDGHNKEKILFLAVVINVTVIILLLRWLKLACHPCWLSSLNKLDNVLHSKNYACSLNGFKMGWMEVAGTMYLPLFGLKLPVVKARCLPKNFLGRGGWVWRFWVDALVFGGQSDDDELALDDARWKKQWFLVKHKILDRCVLISLSLTMTCKKNLLKFWKGNHKKCRLESELLRTGKLIHWVGFSAISYYCTWA